MFKRMRGRGAALALVAGLVAACSQNPVTGRDQLILISEEQATTMGAQAYQEIKQEGKVLPQNSEYTQRIRRITDRLIANNDLPNYQWEVNTLQDDTPNAFALPGGKIGVNTGLTKAAVNDAQIAAVIGHEIAHAVSRHGAERVSQQTAMNTALNVGVALAGGGAGAQTAGQLLAQAATLGVILPYSRTQESEADEIGLYYMARAGYDPAEAVELWKNMKAMASGAPPEFLSTHPDPNNRIARLQELQPKAQEIYRQSEYAPK